MAYRRFPGAVSFGRGMGGSSYVKGANYQHFHHLGCRGMVGRWQLIEPTGQLGRYTSIFITWGMGVVLASHAYTSLTVLPIEAELHSYMAA